jgi:hypothetical protein
MSLYDPGILGHVNESEKNGGLCEQSAIETGARARDGSERGEAGSGLAPPPPALPMRSGCYCPCVGKFKSKQQAKSQLSDRLRSKILCQTVEQEWPTKMGMPRRPRSRRIISLLRLQHQH